MKRRELLKGIAAAGALVALPGVEQASGWSEQRTAPVSGLHALVRWARENGFDLETSQSQDKVLEVTHARKKDDPIIAYVAMVPYNHFANGSLAERWKLYDEWYREVVWWFDRALKTNRIVEAYPEGVWIGSKSASSGKYELHWIPKTAQYLCAGAW